MFVQSIPVYILFLSAISRFLHNRTWTEILNAYYIILVFSDYIYHIISIK